MKGGTPESDPTTPLYKSYFQRCEPARKVSEEPGSHWRCNGPASPALPGLGAGPRTRVPERTAGERRPRLLQATR